MKEVAFTMGYSAPANFDRAFRRFYGVAPSLRTVVASLCVTIAAIAAQNADSFEVASVKLGIPGSPAAKSGGPGSADPGVVVYSNYKLKTLVRIAYGLNAYQISAPRSLDAEVYTVFAKIPPQTTLVQFRAMMRNLLIERFKLASHYEKKDVTVYFLRPSKSGIKLKERVPDTDTGATGSKASITQDGYLKPPPGRKGFGITPWHNNELHLTAHDVTMEDFASMLSRRLSQPVEDASGLTGSYDFLLHFAADAPAANADVQLPSEGAAVNANILPPDLLRAVEEQLGLLLEKHKGVEDILVVDRVEKLIPN